MTTTTATDVLPSAVTHTTSGRVYNFSAGPACLPEEVLKQVQADVWDYRKTGVGILEHSHRAPTFDRMLEETFAECRAAGEIPADFEIVFMPGGATQQFGLIPMAWLKPGAVADYPDTGVWAAKSIQEAKIWAKVIGARINVAFEGSTFKYDHVPAADEIKHSPDAAYFHYCSNNTVYGTRYPTTPVSKAPIICDASSETFARPHEWSKLAMLYAAGQKTLGPAGMVLVVVRKEFVAQSRTDLPSMFDYRTFIAGESRPNTPPTFGIYLMGEMFKWIRRQGGPSGLAIKNAEKAQILYDVMDRSGGYYTGLARKESRSHMNVSFRLPTEDLSATFAREAAAHGLDCLKGHKDAGGIRASIYSAFPKAGCQALAQFMVEFQRTRG
ncbi:MAG: 3-phosphoserine/phosphohydroxythreonine transaminase [Phycisphaerae bacterium]|jgi:phosphoserine aminotransferase|nr:3-phosphoserine/phosphohydroxythreonine transaminase [Phycisphaerae bacterium]